VKISDVLAVPVEVGAAVRHRRLFHPDGVLATGRIERVAPAGEGLPIVSSDVVVRVSKAAGLPGALPDVAGVAWRMPAQSPADRPWDVLLASAGAGLTRVLLRPVTSWTGATFSSLMPLRADGKVWWLRARLVTELTAPGLSLAAIKDHLGRDTVDFDVEQAPGARPFQPLARLTLRKVTPPGEDVSFDPTLNTAPGVALLPGWLTDFRRAAYRRSREGRDAG
jgi:hypothetical protein